ncbi:MULTISPECIES: methyltransferase domain-containing protein [unclassified Crossiella]|uniref:class I SAM-dependent methyltransferase n=1 Tax=unclassified Crossiella TaxID=2620835 RepID=UPI001FFF414B|nr:MULTISPECIES: methyltransferase domain-containing protein [unclassified Crossiella]MCK2239193.1 methyltransferase domain-containing protein [Crossiella sp. S99.2]MCK2251238.1 methyltransferase domain-containing protein [Crossiella sp. S99.1]
MATEFVDWLGVPAGQRWLDVGCGTGALTSAVLATEPHQVLGVDPSAGFLGVARERNSGAVFVAGDAGALPVRDGGFGAVVSGLTLNFVAAPGRAVAEFARAVAPGGVVAAYVWDYADGMQLIRRFWQAAVELDPAALALAESRRFPLCRPEPLRRLWLDAGLVDVSVRAITVPTVFTDFDDYWTPFLGGQGPAGQYAVQGDRSALRELLRERLPTAADGSIPLTATAWAVRGHSSMAPPTARR